MMKKETVNGEASVQFGEPYDSAELFALKRAIDEVLYWPPNVRKAKTADYVACVRHASALLKSLENSERATEQQIKHFQDDYAKADAEHARLKKRWQVSQALLLDLFRAVWQLKEAYESGEVERISFANSSLMKVFEYIEQRVGETHG